MHRELGASGPEKGTTRGPVDEPPPLGSWRGLYALVIANLLLLIALCGWLTRFGR